MAKLSIVAGATSQSINIFIRDSSSTTGAGLTGLAYNTASLAAYYSFAGANATATSITLATLAAVNSAWSSGGFKEIDSTNMPGWYRFDIPNAVLATSKGRSVALHFKGATNMAPCPVEIELTGIDNQDSVRSGMTALPNTACTTNASLLTSGTGTDQVSVSAGKVLLQATQTGVTIPTVTTVTNQLTAAQIATGVWQDATSGDFTVSSSIGKSLYTTGNAPGAASGLALVGSNMGTVTSVSGAVGSVTGNVGGNVVGSVASVTAGVTVSTNNDKTGYSLSVTPPTAAAIATAVWQDSTAGDFTAANSIGKSLGGAFTALGTSVFTTAALVNAPSGGGGGGDCPTTTEIVDAITTAGLPITVTSPVTETGVVTITQGDDYKIADNRALSFGLPSATWGNLSAASVSFVASRSGETIGPIAGSITDGNTSLQAAKIELDPADTADAAPTDGPGEYYKYSVRVTDAGGHLITTFKGQLRLDRNLFA